MDRSRDDSVVLIPALDRMTLAGLSSDTGLRVSALRVSSAEKL